MSDAQELAQINEINKGLTSLNATIDKTADGYLKLVKSIEDGNKNIKDNALSFENLTKAQKQTAENSRQLDSLAKQLEASEKKLKETEDGRLKTIIENKIATQQATKVIQDNIKAEQAEEGSLIRMRQQLIEMQKAYDKTGNRTKEAADEINKLSKEIQKAEFATNRHQRNVGNYADAIGDLPGPIGNAVSSIQGMGKALWTLVANPIGATIAAIVGGLALLYKAFTSTDTGAVKLEGALRAIGNVMDVLLDRAVDYYKMLWSLVTFDWEGVKKNGEKAFKGLGKAVKDAANAGMDYASMMDDIDDREVAAANRMTKLRVDIETLKNRAAKESGKVRIATLQEAMDKEIELNGIEKGFLAERNEVRLKELASKIQDSTLTQEQKEAELRKWLEVDDKELGSLAQKDSAFADFVDKNEKDFQALQKTKAEELNKEAELQTETRRLQKGLATERKEEIEAGIKANKDAQEKAIENLETANKHELSLINQRHIDGKTTEEQYKDELIEQEKNFLKQKQSLYESGTKEYEDTLLQLQEINIKTADEANKRDLDLQKKSTEMMTDSIKEQEDEENKHFDHALQENEKFLKNKEDQEKKYAEKQKELSRDLEEAKEEFLKEGIETIFNINESANNDKLEQLSIEKDTLLSNDKLTKEQRVKIDEEYTKKANDIKRKQKIANKLEAAIEIGIKTAKTIFELKATAAILLSNPITAALAPMALSQIPWVLGMAGLSLASIAKYKEGTLNSKSQFIAGEAGRELIFLRSGDVGLVEQPTFFNGSKFQGAKIFSNPETEKLMKFDHRGNQMTDDRLINEMKSVGNELRSVKKVILNKPVNIVDKENRVIGQKRSHSQEIYLNRLLRND